MDIRSEFHIVSMVIVLKAITIGLNMFLFRISLKALVWFRLAMFTL